MEHGVYVNKTPNDVHLRFPRSPVDYTPHQGIRRRR